MKDGSDWRDNVIATGGGPGLMEAANRGANDVGAPLFELLTLLQTGKAMPMPVVLFDSAYWRRLINFPALVEAGMVSQEHCALFEFSDTPEDAWRSVERRGLRAHG